jgi:hypothetical protein
LSVEQKNIAERLVGAVVQKAQKDKVFRAELINNPHQTLEKFSNAKGTISRSVNIVVDDQTDESKQYLILPKKYEVDDFDLTDEQLEMIAGGEGIVLGTALAWYGAGIAVGALVVGGAYVASHLHWE